MSEEKIKVGFYVAFDKGPWWKTEIDLEDLGYLEFHPGNIPAVGDKIIVKSDIYRVISRYFYKDDNNWSIILKRLTSDSTLIKSF